jgi:hypothetical protein
LEPEMVSDVTVIEEPKSFILLLIFFQLKPLSVERNKPS